MVGRRLRVPGAGLLLALLLALVGASAAAQVPLEVRIREAALDPAGSVRLVVSVTGDAAAGVLDAASFAVTEQGAPVAGLKVEPISESRVQPVAVALVIDVSGSTRGTPLDDAKAAAKGFVERLPQTVRVAVVAFGPSAELRADLTDDRVILMRTIDALAADGATALYDAVALAAQTLARVEAQRNIVLFSDGRDTVSGTPLEAVIAAAKDAQAPVTSVGLETADFDRGALERLAAETGGRSLSVGQSGGLEGAFGQVAQEIASQYVLTYSSARTEPKELDLAVTVNAQGSTAGDAITVGNPRVLPGSTEAPPLLPTPPVGALASRTGLIVGIGAGFLAAALLFGSMLVGTGKGKAARVLQKGLRVYTGSAKKKEPEPGLIASNLGKRAVELVDQIPKPKGFEERVQTSIDRAGWPLRANELLVLQAGGAFVGAVLGFGLFGRFFLGLLLTAIGAALPRLLLKQAIHRRESAFLSQLPDTLQLLAASMQAGYGLLQAVDTVTKETGPPTSNEFARVLTEARLGMPLEDALEGMAERVGGEDFRWVVMAINIQRQVGGNLAALLETVSKTLREREQLRRQVKVLSAEGRLSAVILTLLPFGIAGYLAFVTPEYVGLLLTSGFGRTLIAVGLVAMVLGVVWMRKIVRIEI